MMEHFMVNQMPGVKYNLNSEEGFTILHNYLKHYDGWWFIR